MKREKIAKYEWLGKIYIRLYSAFCCLFKKDTMLFIIKQKSKETNLKILSVKNMTDDKVDEFAQAFFNVLKK